MINENKMFYRIYQDVKSLEYRYYVVGQHELIGSLESWAVCYEDDEYGFPVIVPVMMTQEEFNNLPKFQGY